MATKKITKIISTENGDNYVADIEDIENRISQNSSNLETAKQELSNKCNEALSQAKAYTDQEKAKLFNSTNGTFTGQEYFRNSDEGVLRFNGGNTHDGGASLQLYAKNPHRDVYQQGVFDLVASTKEDTSDAKQLIGRPDGSLTWDNKNIVRSVNGALADNNGNVSISDVEEIGDGYIRLKSGLQICWGSTPGKLNSTPVDFDSIEVNLSKAFKNTGYRVVCTDTGAACFVFGVHVSDTTRFTLYVRHWKGITNWSAYYIAIGMWK